MFDYINKIINALIGQNPREVVQSQVLLLMISSRLMKTTRSSCLKRL
jgi:hypothetical protein